MQIENPPDWLVPWLENQGSMTDKLQAAVKIGPKDLQLQRIAEQWALVGWWERYMLGLKAEALFQREVVILAGDTRCWYARTLVPRLCYTAHATLFSRLQKEPLGALLFGDNGIRRVDLKSYCIDANNSEYYWLDKAWRQEAKHFWLRLSQFTIGKEVLHPFFLIEILLPGLATVTGNPAL